MVEATRQRLMCGELAGVLAQFQYGRWGKDPAALQHQSE